MPPTAPEVAEKLEKFGTTSRCLSGEVGRSFCSGVEKLAPRRTEAEPGSQWKSFGAVFERQVADAVFVVG